MHNLSAVPQFSIISETSLNRQLDKASLLECAYLLCCQKVEFYLVLIQPPLQTLFSLFAGMQVKLHFQQ